MMLLSEYVYESLEDLKNAIDDYRAKGTEVDIALKFPMCPELFVDDLEIGLNILDMDSFVSYKDTGKLDLLVMCRLYIRCWIGMRQQIPTGHLWQRSL